MKNTALLWHGLTVFRSISENETFQTWQTLIEYLTSGQPESEKILSTYHRFYYQMIGRSWSDYLLEIILANDNYFSRQAAVTGADGLDPQLKELAARDLTILQEVARYDSKQLKQIAITKLNGTWNSGNNPIDNPLYPENWPELEQTTYAGINQETNAAPTWLESEKLAVKTDFLQSDSWSKWIDSLAAFYQKAGYGSFNRFLAFRWENNGGQGSLTGIPQPDLVRFDQLIGLANEEGIIRENTEHLLAGLPANNMILYGNRGTGKSSVVKALLHAYASRGLRLVEIAKGDLVDFPKLIRILGNELNKFILFVDDLSFEESEPEYKALKTMLEGGLEAKPDNVLIYATSNRRHLVRETFAERQGDIHARDGLEEKLSLADRFGITVTFPAPDQEAYLQIVEGLAAQRGLQMDRQELRQLALRWEMWHNGRSGRTARQFIDHLTAQQAGK